LKTTLFSRGIIQTNQNTCVLEVGGYSGDYLWTREDMFLNRGNIREQRQPWFSRLNGY